MSNKKHFPRDLNIGDKQIRQLLTNPAVGKVKDIKINGVSIIDPTTKEASFDITASVVEDDSPGTPTANATMQDGNVNIEFEHVKGDKGDKGDQGDSAVFDPETGNILATLHNTLGSDDANAMTQKAVTESLVTKEEVDAATLGSYPRLNISPSLQKFVAVSNNNQVIKSYTAETKGLIGIYFENTSTSLTLYVAKTDSVDNIEDNGVCELLHTVSPNSTCDVIVDCDEGDVIVFTTNVVSTTNVKVTTCKTVLDEIDRLSLAADKTNEDTVIFEQGSTSTRGILTDDSTKVRTKNYLFGKGFIKLKEGYNIYCITYYNATTKAFDSRVVVNQNYAEYGKEGCVTKIVIASTEATEEITPENVYRSSDFYEISKVVEQLKAEQTILSKIFPGGVQFNYSPEFKSSEEIEQYLAGNVYGNRWFSASNSVTKGRTMEYIYAKLDDVVEAHPDNITKFDVVDFLNERNQGKEGYTTLAYPDYAHLGGEATDKYQATPTYQTYLYKISGQSNGENTNHNANAKPNILIIGGTHGAEILAQLNIAVLIQEMLDMSDSELYKLANAFNIWVVPCLCGYGIYHLLRTNYEQAEGGVNINRNYPCDNWEYSDADRNSTGPYPGSEFETQVVMELAKFLKPIVAIDAHHYDHSTQSFYVASVQHHVKRLAFQNLQDFSFAAKKAFPQYFGDKPDLIPCKIHHDNNAGYTGRWFAENIAICGMTVEVTGGFNFIDGEYSEELYEPYYDTSTNSAFRMAEFHLRRMLLKTAEYAYNHLSRGVTIS